MGGSMKQSPAGIWLQVAPVPSRISFGIRAIWYLLIGWMVGLSVISSSLFGWYQVAQSAGSSHPSVGPGEVAWYRRSLVWLVEEKYEILPQGWVELPCAAVQAGRGQFAEEEPWAQVDELLSVGSQWQRPATYWAMLVKLQPENSDSPPLSGTVRPHLKYWFGVHQYMKEIIDCHKSKWGSPRWLRAKSTSLSERKLNFFSLRQETEGRSYWFLQVCSVCKGRKLIE